MILAMAADIVLRRNMRISYTAGPHRIAPSGFDATTHGSHHVELCNEINVMWNSLAERERERGVTQTYGTRAVMPKVDVVETFGLKREELESASHGDMKKDEPEEDLYFIEPSDDLDDALAAAVDGADNTPAPSSPPGAVDTKLISTTGACFCTTIFIVDALTIPA